MWDTAPAPEISLKELVDDLIVEPGEDVLEFRNEVGLGKQINITLEEDGGRGAGE